MRAFAERFLSQQQTSQEKPKTHETSSNMALFQCISDSNLPAHEKSAKRLAHEAVVVISAAAETTSRALSITMFYILSEPQVLRRLRDEIDIAMPDYSILPSAKSLEELPYLVLYSHSILSFELQLTKLGCNRQGGITNFCNYHIKNAINGSY